MLATKPWRLPTGNGKLFEPGSSFKLRVTDASPSFTIQMTCSGKIFSGWVRVPKRKCRSVKKDSYEMLTMGPVPDELRGFVILALLIKSPFCT